MFNMHHSMIHALAMQALQNAQLDQLTVQGLGMLRIYLPGEDNLRLHVWHSLLKVEDVSEVHSHPWDFESYVVAGQIRNTRWTEGEGHPYMKQSLRCGAGGCLLSEPEKVLLHARPIETWTPGLIYQQHADEIHSSHPIDGSVSIIRRKVEEGRSADQAYVYWRRQKDEDAGWVSAEPRPARQEEASVVIATALDLMKEESRRAGSR